MSQRDFVCCVFPCVWLHRSCSIFTALHMNAFDLCATAHCFWRDRTFCPAAFFFFLRRAEVTPEPLSPRLRVPSPGTHVSGPLALIASTNLPYRYLCAPSFISPSFSSSPLPDSPFILSFLLCHRVCVLFPPKLHFLPSLSKLFLLSINISPPPPSPFPVARPLAPPLLTQSCFLSHLLPILGELNTQVRL